MNHHLLGIHHVWPAGPGSILLWDAGFLLWGVLFLGGYLVIRTDSAATPMAGDKAVATDGRG
ncbi:hypothetical protein NJ7G_3159 [Natrinema sp. J7-2]|nr:hypothetical protein NJ7G_3159 [Natrinema sp. J7-2]